MPNRILEAIKRIEAKLKTLEKAKIDKLEKINKTLDSTEHFGYMEAQAHAHAMGILSTAEAQILYQTLSNWSKSPLSHKIVTTKMIGELIGAGT